MSIYSQMLRAFSTRICLCHFPPHTALRLCGVNGMPCLWHASPSNFQLSIVNFQLSVFSSLNNTKGASRPHNLSFTKNSHLIEVRVRLVDQPGFEPRQTVPKTVVLPLHHWSSSNEVAKIQLFFFQKKKK